MPAPEVTLANLNAHKVGGKKKKWRRLVKPRDRWGREYVMWLDHQSGDPVGTIERRFLENVPVPDSYLKFDQEEPWRVQLDLERYAADLRRGRAEWDRIAAAVMVRKYGQQAYDEQNRVRPLTPEVRDIVGPPPQDWRLVELLRRGDAWCLGMTTKRTAAVTAILGAHGTFLPEQRNLEPEAEGFDLGDALEALAGRSPMVKGGFADELDAAARMAYERAARAAPPMDGPAGADFTGADGGPDGGADGGLDDFDEAALDEELAELSEAPVALRGPEFAAPLDGLDLGGVDTGDFEADLAAELEEAVDRDGMGTQGGRPVRPGRTPGRHSAGKTK